MSGKVVVLKPMAWNTNGYVRPDGTTRTRGYVGKSGFGHEEWNGDHTRLWNGQRVFHTETTDRMTAWGDGRLGIIMTAYKPGGGPHALGVAVGVLANRDEDKTDIFGSLEVARDADLLWSLPSVRPKHKSLADLRKWWAEEGLHNNWRCQQRLYAWFEQPLPLDPEGLFPPTVSGVKAPDIIKMHGRFMAIRQDQTLAILRASLDEDSPILEWVKDGPFDPSTVSRKTSAHGKPKLTRKALGEGSAAAADEDYIRYVRTHEIKVSARHAVLQKRFRRFLEQQLASAIRENVAGVDVQFSLPNVGHILTELKPCDDGEVRYAVRTAMGQLLDYGQRHRKKPVRLLVVLDTTPSDEDRELALRNGFGIAHPAEDGFAIKWPSD